MRNQNKTASPVLRLKAVSEEGEFEGYGSTFGGEPDVYGDVIAKGAFARSLAEHKDRGTMPKLLWQHDPWQPIGKYLEMREDETGLFVRGQLNMGVQQGSEAAALLREGDIDGLSIGFRLRAYEVDQESDVWTLTDIDLREVSVVSMPANVNAVVTSAKSERASLELRDRLAAGDRLTEREFETLLKGALGLSNSQAERAARVHLKGRGEPATDADDMRAFLRMLRQP